MMKYTISKVTVKDICGIEGDEAEILKKIIKTYGTNIINDFSMTRDQKLSIMHEIGHISDDTIRKHLLSLVDSLKIDAVYRFKPNW